MPFFANMGGFLLKTPNKEAQPLNGALLFSLIRKGYLEYPDITDTAIDDKNKRDNLARYI